MCFLFLVKITTPETSILVSIPLTFFSYSIHHKLVIMHVLLFDFNVFINAANFDQICTDERSQCYIPSLYRHLSGFSKLAFYPVWRFKEVSNVGVRIKKKSKQFWHVSVFFVTLFHSIDFTKALTTPFKNKKVKTTKYIEKLIFCRIFLFVGGLTRVFNNG